MYFYEVLVSGSRFHGEDSLTYSSADLYETGQLVMVPIRADLAHGVVVGRTTTAPKYKTKSIVRAIAARPLPSTSLKLLDWMRQYYPAPLGLTVGQFIPAGLAQAPRARPAPPASNLEMSMLPPLIAEQASAIEIISAASGSVLLHGETGSGKTRLYMELAVQAVGDGRDVLVMTPEISLSPQLFQDFGRLFGERVILLHSGLTNAERRDAWLKVLAAEQPVVVIGPRSALFAPFRQLGLVVIDEAHEAAYKQESAPYYDARRVAAKLASLHQARLIYGTATPNVSDYYLATATGAPIVRLTKLATSDKVADPDITVVQQRDRDQFSRHPNLSNVLLKGIEETLNKGEQSLIFLNRRGTARLILCQVCGWQALCPNCDLPVTYHGDNHELVCHTCGHHEVAPASCANCGASDIVYRSLGTKSLLAALERLFPGSKLQRFDADNAKAERFEKHYQAVARGEVDILVGTQLLTKGLDLPKLGFVGVVSADTALGFPDFTASERTYQLLTQVIGRVGRGHRAGRAVIQTYHPDSPAVLAAVDRRWPEFYEAELAERRLFRFPPFVYLLKLTVSRKTLKGAQKAADDLAANLRGRGLPIQVVGPSPSFYARAAGQYRWQLVVKAKNRAVLAQIVKNLPAKWVADLDPSNLL